MDNHLAQLMHYVVDSMAGLLPQDDQKDAPPPAKMTDAVAYTKDVPTDIAGTFSAPLLVPYVPPKAQGMPLSVTKISESYQIEVVTQLATIIVKVGHIEGGVGSWMGMQFEAQDGRVQEFLDSFKSRITQQLGNEKAPNVVDIRAEIAEIHKIVTNLYERQIIAELVVETMIPTIDVPNIWVVSINMKAEETQYERREKKKKNKIAKTARKKVRLDSIQDQKTQLTRVLEISREPGGPRAPVSITGLVTVMAPTIIESISVDGIVSDQSRIRPKGPCTNVDAMVH